MQVDEARFGTLVERTLDNAGNWRNAFEVAYEGLQMDNEAISRHVVAWVESALPSNRMQRAWAEALLNRYGKVPDDSAWATDPIASRLNDRVTPELRKSLRLMAEEAQQKRERR
jgi:hypothetical protein